MAIQHATAHPLEPLAPPELERAAGLVRASLRDARFVSIGLHEPAKADYLEWLAGGARPARCALAIAVDHEHRVHELVCDLDAGALTAQQVVPGARSPITPEDYDAAAEAVRADSAWREAMARHGVDDVSLVQIDVLASGGFGLEVERGRRVARAVAYLRRQPGDNGYAHPIESLIAYVDVDECRVLELEQLDVKPIPEADGAYAAGVVPARGDLRPIEITQPEGVSFAVEGNEVRWHRWSLRTSVDAQEGLVLHDVRFDGRPVLHRASCAEMIVPYGESHPMHSWRTYFDAGEYGLGACTNSLALGCDCVGEIRYLDAHLVDREGRPRVVPDAICLHEEDAGLLWKHSDHLAGRVEVRRARRFVVNSMVTVGNYDYAFRWYLHLDGSIECEVQLHGIVSTMALAPGEQPAGSSVIDRGLAAPNHQHFFCFRLDLDVDGVENSVREVESEAIPRGAGESPRQRLPRARDAPRARVGRAAGERRSGRLASGTSSTPCGGTASAARSATGSFRCTACRRCLRSPMRASRRARALRGTPSGSRGTTTPSAIRPAVTPTGRRRPSAYRSGATPTARSRRATWCSGTRSARRISCVPRTGRSCRSPVPAFGWNRSGSSIATRRWTSRRRTRAAAGPHRPRCRR